MQQVSYGPLIMSMLIMSCYTRFFNVRRGWQSLNTGPRFYLRLIRRTGWLWISISRTTDGRPFKPKKLSVPFLYPGVPAGFVEGLKLGTKSNLYRASVTVFPFSNVISHNGTAKFIIFYLITPHPPPTRCTLCPRTGSSRISDIFNIS